MQPLKDHERFEIEVLAFLNKTHFLNKLIFGGGTCLRLCYGLSRYSTDLDFWAKPKFSPALFSALKKEIQAEYEITDFHEKHFTFLWEIRSPRFPNRLKIEIRKKLPSPIETQLSIAFSPHDTRQVRLQTFSLKQMWKNKLAAFVERGEIRDAYDLEFLLRRGVGEIPEEELREKVLARLKSFKKRDFDVQLGSLLEPAERAYYSQQGFSFLAQHFTR